MNPQFPYPATPTGVPAGITQPSVAFKKEVTTAAGSIFLFLVVYLIMFVLSVALVIGCLYAGFMLIVNVPRTITIIIGLGLMGLGVMVFVFLIKFMFAVSRYDRSGIIEVTEDEQPRLYAFIRQLTKDTQTPFPKKIYLSPDVNACVFYNSSFWSMFFPIRKNLQIGLGLVNSVNISEFKAVMAHEFGHFSQRSMKVGSFVYNVNRIIYNMLFENNSYSNFLQGWANIGSISAFFANITAGIARGIQWILRQMYAVINKSYMRLSREMEFHADAVAASVSGSKSLVTALRRIELADAGYNIVLQKCDDLFRQKKISGNIYHNQRIVMKQLADKFNLEVQHELPVISSSFVAGNNFSRVNFKDQWASHPSTDDREKHLDNLAVNAEILPESAWVLFDNASELQQQLTNKLYERAIDGQEVTSIDGHEFEKTYYEDVKNFVLPQQYNGFYDDRLVTLLDEQQLIPDTAVIPADATSFFLQENTVLHKQIAAMTNDMNLLKAISAGNIDTKSFDFDGIKYNRQDVPIVISRLEAEQQEAKRKLGELDKKAIHYFLLKARQAGKENELKSMYLRYYGWRRDADEYLKQMNAMLEQLAPIYSGQTIPIEQINAMIDDLKNSHEIKLKGWLKKWLALGTFDQPGKHKELIEKFIPANYVYFSGSSFMDTELQELDTICHQSWDDVNKFLFARFKEILEYQLTLK
jgi:Zn-dependent protease with chaperone function